MASLWSWVASEATSLQKQTLAPLLRQTIRQEADNLKQTVSIKDVGFVLRKIKQQIQEEIIKALNNLNEYFYLQKC